MATTISSGRGSSPKLTADVASRAEVNGGRAVTFDGIVDYLTLGNSSIFNHSGNYSISVWIKKIGEPSGNRDTNDNPTIIAKGNVYFTLFVNGEGMLGTFFYNNSSANDYNVKTTDGVIKLNVWHHIVLTWNNTSSQLYVDGKQEYSGSYTPYNLHTGVNGKEIRIGDRETPSTDTRWHGNMSDMKIFDSHLTEAQVQELYLKPEQSAPSAVQSNLKAWYPMCEGLAESIAYDHSGNNNHAVENGSYTLAVAENEPIIPQIPLVKSNEKMLFDGHYLNLPSTLTSASNYTLVAWINTLNTGQAHLFMGASGNDNFQMHSGRIWWYQDADHYSTTYINDGKTYMIAYQREGNNYSIWVNGIKETSWTQTSQNDYQTFQLSKIGSSNGSRPYKGLINDVSAWSTALSSSEMLELYNSGTALDATTHSKSGNLLSYYRNDGVTTWKNRADNYASFDGVNDIITRDAINVNYKSFSIWVRPNSTISTSPYVEEGALIELGTTKIHIGEYTGTATNALITVFFNSGGWYYSVWENASSFNVPNDSWSHIGLSWDGSKYQIYFNGQPQTTTTFGDNGHVPLINNGAISLGKHTTYYYEGDLTNFALWSESLTAPQMLSIYNAGHNGDISSIQSSDLELYYTFNPNALTDLDTNSTVQDRSGNNRDSTSVSGASIDRTGTVAGSPNSVTIREGLTSGKDGLGFSLKDSIGNVLRLNGVDEYVEVAETKSLQIDTGMTLEAWIKTSNTSANQFIVAKDDGTQRDYILLTLQTTGKVRGSFWGGSSDTEKASDSTTNVCDGNWHHVVSVFKPSTYVRTYVDGKLESENTTSIHDYLVTDTEPISIGRRGDNTLLFNGLIDEVKIYNRALTDGGVSVGSMADGEIKKNYKHGKGKHKND